MDWDADSLENLYYAIAALIVAYLTVHGWKQGVARQAMTLLALAGAYTVGYFGAGLAAPWFEFLKYPEPITKIIGGVAAGTLTLFAISTVGRIAFKRTVDQAPGKKRLSYGTLGALLGLIFGGLVFMVTSEFVRLLGALAQSNVQVAALAAGGDPSKPQVAVAVNPVVQGLARLSSALDKGDSGSFFRKVDPVPAHVFATLTKLGIMASRPDAVDRFLAYPGIRDLAQHPKLLALQRDPEVNRLLEAQSYFRLLRHEKVLALASDPEFSNRIRGTDFNQAIDYALKDLDVRTPGTPESRTAPFPAPAPAVIPPPAPVLERN